jgi:hypothetical protein
MNTRGIKAGKVKNDVINEEAIPQIKRKPSKKKGIVFKPTQITKTTAEILESEPVAKIIEVPKITEGKQAKQAEIEGVKKTEKKEKAVKAEKLEKPVKKEETKEEKERKDMVDSHNALRLAYTLNEIYPCTDSTYASVLFGLPVV